MKTAHTPGPWKVVDNRNLSVLYVVATPIDRGICTISRFQEHEKEQHANSKLIAAAPDLLKFAERIKAIASADPHYSALVKEADVLIKKATI